MKKYWVFAKMSWQQALEYRAEGLVWFFNEVIGIVPPICLWLFLQNTGRLNPTQTSALITYNILSLLISRVTASEFETWLINDIKDGKISTHFLKPYSFQIWIFVNELVWRVTGLIYLLPTLFIAYYALSSVIDLKNIFLKFTLTAPLLILIFVSRYLVSFILSLTAFWIDQSQPLVHLKWMLTGILGGAWYPLYFMPDMVIKIAKFTPFYYWYFFPIQWITGKLSQFEVITSLLAMTTWVVVLFVINKFLWQKAVKYYGAFGS